MKTFKSFLHVMFGLLLLSSLSFGTTLESFRTSFDTAMKAYNAQEYANAYQLFYALVENAPENAEVNFYLGRSALELKKYDDAMVAFDRVLMLNPSHTRTRLELARLYFETKQYELAQTELDSVLQEKLPQNVQETVHNFKRAIEQQREKHTFGGALILAWDYDTNIANDVGRGVTQNLLGLVNLPGNDRRSSAGLSQVLLLNHTYDIGEKGSWAWESNFLAYNKNLTQYSDKDLLLFSFATGPSYTIDTYKISFLASHENIRLASEEYLNTSGFAINVKKIISPTLLVEADISKKRNINEDSTSTSDSDTLVYTLGFKQSFGDDPWLFSAYIAYQDENERDKVAAQYGVSLDEWSYRVELSKEIFKGIKGTLGYTYKDIEYKEFDAFFNLKRKDKENYYSINLSYEIDKESSISLGYTYADHGSNNALNDYTKNVTTLSYMRTF
jgi:tetratricopeptide (TPR) repeat protein